VTSTETTVQELLYADSYGRTTCPALLSYRLTPIMSKPSDTDPIEVSLGKRGGEPVFRGTRIPISYLAQYLQHGYTAQDFIEQYDIDPDLVREVYRKKFGDENQGREVPA